MINNHFSELFRCEAPQSKIGLRYGALWGVMVNTSVRNITHFPLTHTTL